VGIIGAAGTGIQELSVHLHRAGVGVSHAIGTGGRDLSKEVGGITTKAGLDILEQDSLTDIIIILTKPSDGGLPTDIMNRVSGCKKPVYFVLLGMNEKNLRKIFGSGNYAFSTIESVLKPVLYKLGKGSSYLECLKEKEETAKALAIKRMREWDTQGLVIRGGFCGGSLTAESLCVLQQMSISAESNIRMTDVEALSDSRNKHRIIDFGAEEYTEERAHPMADPALRNKWLRDESEKAKSPIILLFDIMLGFGSHSDPAGSIVSDLHNIYDEKRVLAVTSVCGVREDTQNADMQIQLLESQGIIVAPSNAAAARISASLVPKSSGEIL
jgi:FdrA protein